MKTNTLNIILATVAVSSVALIATTKIAASYFDLMAIGVGYTAVAVLTVLALFDYRGRDRNHIAR